MNAPLIEAFKRIPPNEVEDMVRQYFGNRLLQAVTSSPDKAAGLASVLMVRNHPLVELLSEPHRGKILYLCTEAEELIDAK